MLIVALFKGQKIEHSQNSQPCDHTRVLLPENDGRFVLMQKKESLNERRRPSVISRTVVRESVGKHHEVFAAL